MTIYSTQTLERIAERDCVDRLFREECLRKELATADEQLKQIFQSGVIIDLIVAPGFGFSLYKTIDNLPDISIGYLALAGLAGFALIGTTSMLAGIMVERRNDKRRFKNPDLEKGDGGFYLIDGKVSSKGTILEKAFGGKIKAYFSLKDATERPEKGIKYGFIDHLTVGDVNKFQWFDEENNSSYGVFESRFVDAFRFEIKRFHETIYIDYQGASPPADLIRVSNNKKEFAMLFVSPLNQFIKKGKDIPYQKIYSQHP